MLSVDFVSLPREVNPSNPFPNDPPDAALSGEERPIGGLGVHLVRNFMDKVAYERHGEDNVVTLVKHLGESQQDQSES